MWIKPVSRDLMLHAPIGKESVQIMSDTTYNSVHLWTIMVLCFLRLAVIRLHLQAYLNLADCWVEQMKREAGRITVLEIQQKVWRSSGAEIQCWDAGDPVRWIDSSGVDAQVTQVERRVHAPN
ncbi:transmembrane protein 161A-like isoform X2 [Sceloporus undulatus]|nr:transmembrane protein 161A-like isoform X2 [Sceloporus undulatus]